MATIKKLNNSTASTSGGNISRNTPSAAPKGAQAPLSRSNNSTRNSLTGVNPSTNDKELSPKAGFNNAPPKFQDTGPSPEVMPPPPVIKHDGSASFIPAIKPSEIQQPQSECSVDFALDQFARVMIELAEKQDDPIWAEQHAGLADRWHNLIATLLQHAVDMESTRGEVELKQQQMVHNDMDHQQNMGHQETLNKQTLQHNEDQHKQNLAHQDQMNKMNKMNMQQTQAMNKQQQMVGDQTSKMKVQQGKEIHQNKMQFTKAQQATRLQQMGQKKGLSQPKTND